MNATQLLFYNKPLLDAAGVAYPGEDERWTWEQVVEAATKVKEANPDVSGFDWEQRTAIYQLQPLAGSFGARRSARTACLQRASSTPPSGSRR